MTCLLWGLPEHSNSGTGESRNRLSESLRNLKIPLYTSSFRPSLSVAKSRLEKELLRQKRGFSTWNITGLLASQLIISPCWLPLTGLAYQDAFLVTCPKERRDCQTAMTGGVRLCRSLMCEQVLPRVYADDLHQLAPNAIRR